MKEPYKYRIVVYRLPEELRQGSLIWQADGGDEYHSRGKTAGEAVDRLIKFAEARNERD